MGHFVITDPEGEHAFHASNVRGAERFGRKPQNVRGVQKCQRSRDQAPSTNKRDGSVPHAPRTHVPLHSRSADTHLIPKMSEEHCNEGTIQKYHRRLGKSEENSADPPPFRNVTFSPLTGTVRGKKVEGGPRGSAEVPRYFHISVFFYHFGCSFESCTRH